MHDVAAVNIKLAKARLRSFVPQVKVGSYAQMFIARLFFSFCFNYTRKALTDNGVRTFHIKGVVLLLVSSESKGGRALRVHIMNS